MSGTLVLLLRVLLALVLYAFLCAALWMSWQELRQASARAVLPRVPPLRVEVRLQGANPFFRAFAQPHFTLGRDPVCELSIDDEAISARHAKFSFHHGQWWLEDLHSTNGTRLNQLKVTTATVLTNGDEIGCGDATLLVKLDTQATQTPHPAEAHHD